MEALMEVRQLKKTYTKEKSPHYVLNQVSFRMERGETVGLIGASGAGKSTIGRIITGLETASGGEVLFHGHGDLLSMRGKDRRRLAKDIQMVFQDPYDALSARMKIGDIVEEPLVIQGIGKGNPAERHERVRDALLSVSLDPDKYVNRYPHELSGGERQRAGLARAFVCRPSLIIADEPTSMLDTSLRLELIGLMRKMNKELGISFLFITHDIALTRGFCDRLIVLEKGQIAETGPTEDVIMNPQHPYTQSLIGALRALESHGGMLK